MKFSQDRFEFPERPLILAHRGSQLIKKYPENSLPAFKEGLALGADGIELDIRLSADHEIMVFHDHNLLRLLGIERELSQFSSVQLQNFRFVNQLTEGLIKIPTLNEVIQEFGSRIYYNIEIKQIFGSYKILVQKLYEMIEEFGIGDKVWISSFDPRVLWLWRHKYSKIPLALLFDRWRLWERWLCYQNFVDILHPGVNLIRDITEIQKLEKRICFWTVNSINELEKMKNYRLMGIISDNIPLIKEISKSDFC
jgi:glycerophosphoryl diester phosphodiesterase